MIRSWGTSRANSPTRNRNNITAYYDACINCPGRRAGRTNVELEGCRLADAAGGYLCSIRSTWVSRSLINNGIMQMGNLSLGRCVCMCVCACVRMRVCVCVCVGQRTSLLTDEGRVVILNIKWKYKRNARQFISADCHGAVERWLTFIMRRQMTRYDGVRMPVHACMSAMMTGH